MGLANTAQQATDTQQTAPTYNEAFTEALRTKLDNAVEITVNKNKTLTTTIKLTPAQVEEAYELVKLGANPKVRGLYNDHSILCLALASAGKEPFSDSMKAMISALVNQHHCDLNNRGERQHYYLNSSSHYQNNHKTTSSFEKFLNLELEVNADNALFVAQLGADLLATSQNGNNLLGLLASAASINFEVMKQLSPLAEAQTQAKAAKEAEARRLSDIAYAQPVKDRLVELLTAKLAKLGKKSSFLSLFSKQETAEKITFITGMIQHLNNTEFATRAALKDYIDNNIINNKALMQRRLNKGNGQSKTAKAIISFYERNFQTYPTTVYQARAASGSSKH